MKKNLLVYGAVVVLLIALAFSYVMQNKELQERSQYYQVLLGPQSRVEAIADNAVKIIENNQVVGFAGLEEYNGFGGPMLVGMVTDPQGIITKLEILEHKETPQYLVQIEEKGFFKQYRDKFIDSGMTFGVDIDGIAAATLSTRAIAVCADEISESIRVAGLGLPSKTATIPWQLGLAEIAVAAILAGMLLLSTVKSLQKLRPVLLIISVITIGFWLNRPLAISQISGVFLGYFPAIKTNLIWYLLLAGALLPPLLTGKNHYCTYVCPFGAATQGIHFAAKRIALPLGDKVLFLRKTRNLIVFLVLLLAFLFQNPSISSFEPFATLFTLNGTGIQWLLLGAVLTSALFFKRFWCNGFCPMGGFLDLLASFRRKLGKLVKKNTHTQPQTIPLVAAKPCANQEGSCGAQALSKKEKLAEGLFKLFYAVIIFSVFVAIFEKWSIL